MAVLGAQGPKMIKENIKAYLYAIFPVNELCLLAVFFSIVFDAPGVVVGVFTVITVAYWLFSGYYRYKVIKVQMAMEDAMKESQTFIITNISNLQETLNRFNKNKFDVN